MTVDLLYPHRGGALRADDDAGFEEGRVYYWTEGDVTYELDSVTSIMKAGIPKGERLLKWVARECGTYTALNINDLSTLTAIEVEKRVKAAPFDKRDTAADLGTDVHAYMEAVVLGEPLPKLSPVGQKKAALFERWLAEHKPKFIAAECWVFNLGRRYAGRFDFIAETTLGVTLGDYKTGKGVYPEVGLQLAALRNAEFIGLADGTRVDMPTVDACAVLHIQLRQYKFQRVRAERSEWLAFLHAQQVAEWRKTADADVIGDHIAKPPKYAPRPNAPVCVASMLD